MRNSLGFALLLAALLIAPSAALAASTQCLCNNGKKMHTSSDAEDACESICDMFGGGSVLVPEEGENEPVAEDAAPVRRSVVVSPPAAGNPAPGTVDPRNQP